MSDTIAFPTHTEALRVWLRIGLLSFGGPAGQIALMHREIVEQRHWVGERTFLRALSFCALLPGPEAQQLATYLGLIMHGPLGGIAAGTLFVLPGAAVLLALSITYATLGQVPAVDGLFFGLKCAVLALVAQAVLRLGRRALKSRAAVTLAGAAFAALWAFSVPFPLVILVAGLIGAARPAWFRPGGHGNAAEGPPGLVETRLAAGGGTAMAASARRAGLVTLALWLVPVAALWAFAPGRFAEMAVFFSKMAVITFGGAYAVLAYVAQSAVHAHHWLSAPEMLAGLGLAETTPGPLILVLQFVGFLAGYRAPGAVGGIAGGIAGSVLTLWVTFLPCFSFVFLGAPLIERIAGARLLAAALAAVTAAVVGVIANLALWFGLHVLFGAVGVAQLPMLRLEYPVPSSLEPAALAVAAVAAVLTFRLRRGVPAVLGVCAALGMALRLAFPAHVA